MDNISAEQLQASRDLFAYVDTLDAAETLGELAHLDQMHQRLNALGILSGIDTGLTEQLMLHVVLALGRRLEKVLDVEAKEPSHDLIHSCSLLTRLRG